MESYSYDLKSATDRWTLSVLFEGLAHLFDAGFAPSVVHSALASNILNLAFSKDDGKTKPET
jgi:hypothetical protein